MSLSVDPKFKKWFESRKLAQHLKTEIPTRNANPTPAAGKKNSNGPKRGSSKTSVTVPRNSNGKGTKTVTEKANLNVVKSGVKKLSNSKSISRPRGKY